MANLQKFRDLLDQAESLDKEIDQLTIERDNLLGEKVMLLASSRHAREQAEKFREEAKEARESGETEAELQKTAHSQALQELESVKADIKSARTMLAQIGVSISAQRSEYDELVGVNGEKIEELRTEVKHLSDIKDSTQNEVDLLTGKMSSLRESIDTAETELSKLKESVAQESEAAKKLHKLTIDIQAKQELLDDLAVNYEKMGSEVDEFETKRTEFLEYEENAKKTLAAHEQSLIDQRKELDLELSKAKRRNKLLGE